MTQTLLSTIAWLAFPSPGGTLSVNNTTYALKPLAAIPKNVIGAGALVIPGASEPAQDDLALALARAARTAVLGDELKAALLAEFNSWTPAQRYALNGARMALNDDLTSGNIAAAIEGVTGYPLPDSSLAPLQTDVLATLNTYASKFTALAAAATVEAVNAIN